MQQSTSPFAQVNLVDIKKTAIHLLLAALISFGLYLINTVVPQLQFTGNWAIVLPFVSGLADFARRFLTNYSNQI